MEKERRKIFRLRQNIWFARQKKMEKERVENILAGKNIWRKKKSYDQAFKFDNTEDLKRLRNLIEEYC